MMIFLKLLLSSELIFIAATASIRNESLCYQSSKYIKAIHYDIKLLSYIKRNIFYGECNISINILNKTQRIYLHSEQLCIKNIVLIKNFERYHENDNVYKPAYNIKEDTIDIIFMDELSPGNYILNIKYLGTAEVFRIFDDKRTAWIATPHVKVISARRSLPCRDQQDLLLEATFNISIGCKQCTALSNMLLRNTENDENNLLWRHFDTTPVMSPYLATMIVSNYLFLFYDKIQKINMWCRNESRFHIEFAKNVTKRITPFFESEWRYWYTLESKVDHVAIPNYHDKDIIVLGLVLYRETNIIYDKNIYPIAHKIEVAQLVGRKVTQQWFNYMMNNPLVPDFWFKKGLTTLLAMYAVNKTYPDYQIINLFVVQNQHYSFNLDSDYYMWNSTSQVNSSLEIPNSIRAPFILRMMQHVLTEEIFWKGIHSYLNSTQLYNQSSVKFWEEIVAAAEKPVIALETINYWAVEEHCPLIKISRNNRNREIIINVSIQNIDKLKIDCLPVTFTTAETPDFNNSVHHIVCVSKDLIITLPFEKYGWMIFNIRQIGYYRVNYDDQIWKQITNYLSYYNYKKIHVLNRAQIIDDAFYLMIIGQLKFHIFVDIIWYLHQEEDYIAWYPVFKALEYVFSTFPIIMLKNNIFKIRTSRGLINVLERIKYEEIDDSDDLIKCLRQEAARWICFLDNYACKREANNKLIQHLQDPTKYKLLPWWKEWTYCKGLMIAKKQTWQLVYDIGLKKSDSKYIEFLACTEDTDIIINYFLPRTSTQRKYLSTGFLHIITKHAKNETILQHILDNFTKIKPKHVDITAALIIIINNVYSVNLTELIMENVERLIKADLDNRMNNAKDLLNNYLFNSRYLKKTLIMQYSDKIESKISIRNNEINKQVQYAKRIRFNHWK